MNPFESLSLEEKRAAASVRISERAYADVPVEQEKVDQLSQLIAAINDAEECLDFGLVGPLDDAGEAVGISHKLFTGTFHWYATLRCDDNAVAREKCGYFGEELILLAAHLGLGTCWVGGTFDREKVVFDGSDGKILLVIIPIGYALPETPLAQRTMRKSLRMTDKKPSKIIEADVPFDEVPQWVRDGASGIIAGPSAVNKQPVVLDWRNGVLTAGYLVRRGRFETCDFGIGKLHFEIGSGKAGKWDWGAGGAFHPAE